MLRYGLGMLRFRVESRVANIADVSLCLDARSSSDATRSPVHHLRTSLMSSAASFVILSWLDCIEPWFWPRLVMYAPISD